MDYITKIILSPEYQKQKKLVYKKRSIVRQAEKFADKVEKMLSEKAPNLKSGT